MACLPENALLPLDLDAWRAGNTGIDYVTRFDTALTGPNVLIVALTHGNEVCGAHALDFLLRSTIRPRRGSLTLAFANIAAYLRFDPEKPSAVRFVDEDLNRVWSPDVLDGRRHSTELQRARELRPILDRTDFLLDLHSMQTPSPALMLAGMQEKGRLLAGQVGLPDYIVADAGHAAGRRMRDYGDFADERSPRTALLVECGQHYDHASRLVAIETMLRFMLALDLVDASAVRPHLTLPTRPQQVIEVTGAVTVQTNDFRFNRDYGGLEIISRAGTVIGHDGDAAVVTPYDRCALIMPTHRLRPGQTAVRFGRTAG